MNFTRLTSLVLALATCFALSAGAAAMGTKKSTTDQTASASSAKLQPYTWYDGNRAQTAWLDPQLVAEFDGKSSVVKNAVSGARQVPMQETRGVKIWQVDGGAEQAIAKARAVPSSSKLSPVFHDGPSAGGRMRALPGNVIVFLNPNWNQASVEEWAAKNKVEIARKLEIGPNVFVVKTGPGLEALDKANALRTAEGVVSTTPNWWQEVTTR